MTDTPPRARVCLVTTGHPATNPRLVKEADALTGAGYAVRVVACSFLPWADRADAEFAGRPWAVERVRFGAMASRATGLWQRLRRRVASRLVEAFGFRSPLAERALHYVVPELTRLAAREPADLFIAHNLAALPAAAAAARRHGARLGFDAEDFHRGEYAQPEGPDYALTCWAEECYVPACDYVTAASEGIAAAYADVLSISLPVTIDNVFPLADRVATVREAELKGERAEGTRTLYWFSQTIGPGRGLEDVLAALPLLDDDIHLALRGRWADGYDVTFLSRAEALGVRDRVRWLAPVPPGELVVRTARHDVGLALERPRTRNREVCVSNKIFTYLLAGIPAIATETEGQRRICAHTPEATRLVRPGDVEAFAEAVRALLAEGEAARSAAVRVATERFNWEHERERFLQVVGTCLGANARPDGAMGQTLERQAEFAEA